MTRRRTRGPAPEDLYDERTVAWEYRWLGRLWLACGDPALGDQIRQERDRLKQLNVDDGYRLRALWVFVEELGAKPAADRFLRHMLQVRSRHTPPDHFPHRRRDAGRKD